MMTKQEIFNTAYIGIRNQGFRQSVKNTGGVCQYRHEDMKCAFGHLIPAKKKEL